MCKNPSFIFISLLFMPHYHPCICFFSTASGKCPQTFQCKGTIVGGLGSGRVLLWKGNFQTTHPNCRTDWLHVWWSICTAFKLGLQRHFLFSIKQDHLQLGIKKKKIISSPSGPSGWTTAQLRDALAVDQSQHHGQRQSQTLHSKI